MNHLTRQQFADLAGIKSSTLDAYITRGLAPKEDGWFGNQRYWHEETVNHWIANRIGQGARTDLPTSRAVRG